MTNPNQVPIQWTPPTTTDNVTTGPLAHAQQELNIRQRAHQQAQVPYERYGPTPEQLRKEIAELVKGVKHQPRASIKFSVTGQSKPITFTPAELYEAASDPKFAERVYTATTGMANASRRDIEDFQARIQKNHPEVMTAGIAGTYGPQDIEDILVPHPTPVPHVVAPAALAAMTHEAVPTPESLPAFANTTPPNAGNVMRGQPAAIYASAPLLKAYRDFAAGNLTKSEIDRVFNEVSNADFGGRKIATAYPTEIAAFKRAIDLQEKKNKQIAERPEEERRYKEQVEGAERYRKYQESVQERNTAAAAHRAAMAANPALAATQKQVALEELKNALGQRAGQEGAERKIYEKGATVAPLNEFHKQAERINLNSIGSQDEDFKLAQQAVRQLQGRKDMADVVQPYLTEAMKHPREFVNQYHNAHEQSVIDHMREEVNRNFLDKVLPSINARFPMGSGVREAILQSHAEKMERDLNKNIAELRHRNFDNAMRMSEGHRNLNMQGAQVAGNAELNHNQRVLSNLNALQGQNIANKSMNENDARNAMQMGTVHQQQAQNIMNRNVAEFERAKLHEPEQLRTEIENINHLPITQTATRTLSSMPPPQAPSFPGVMGGILGQTANMYRNASLQPPQGAYRGGHMKFAQGGTVAHHEGAIQSYADKVAKPYFDPLGNWMSHMTPAIFQAAGAPELAQAARGEHASREAHQDRKAQGWKTAADLHNTLLQSKFDQKRILQEYQRHRENLAETSRHNRATEQEHVAKLIEKNAPKEVQIGEHTIKPKNKMGMTPADIRHMEKVDKEIKDLEKLKFGYKRYLEHLDELDAKNYHPPTGEIYEALPQSWKNDLGIRDYMLRQNVVGNEAQEGARAFVAALAQSGRQKISPGMSYPMRREDIVQKLEELDPHLEEKIYSKEFAAGDIPGRKTEGIHRKWVKAGKPGAFELYAKAYLEGTPLPNKTNGRTTHESDDEDTSALEAEYKALKQRNSKAGIG